MYCSNRPWRDRLENPWRDHLRSQRTVAARNAAATEAHAEQPATSLQIDENVERELINHRTLVHPNIVKFREVSST